MDIKLTPKQTFCEDKDSRTKHSDFMSSPAFKTAASHALLEYQFRMANSEPTIAAVKAYKLDGAQEFLALLMNFGEPETIRQTMPKFALQPPEEFDRTDTVI